MSTTIDGIPWRDYRSLGPKGPTNEELNRDCLAPLSREHHFCLCLHPFMGVINFSGLECDWCGQKMEDISSGPAAREMRTAAILAMYPHLAKGNDNADDV